MCLKGLIRGLEGLIWGLKGQILGRKARFEVFEAQSSVGMPNLGSLNVLDIGLRGPILG